MRKKSAANKISPKVKSTPWGVIVITMILLSPIIGYLIYNFPFNSSPRWTTEDVAPKKDREFLRKVKEDLKTETVKEQVSQKQILEMSRVPISTAEIKMTSTRNKNEDQTEKQSKTSDIMKLPNKIVINFELNSNELAENAYRDLGSIAQLVTKYPNLAINIEGYTDSLGTYSYNKKLSKFRAEIVKKYFVGKGIDSFKITAVGHGAKGFIATNDTEEGRRLNRRVEIQVKAE